MATLNTEQLEFQEYARRWLEENRPPPPRERLPITPLEVMTEAHRDYLQDWQAKVHAAGLKKRVVSMPRGIVIRRLASSALACSGLSLANACASPSAS